MRRLLEVVLNLTQHLHICCFREAQVIRLLALLYRLNRDLVYIHTSSSPLRLYTNARSLVTCASVKQHIQNVLRWMMAYLTSMFSITTGYTLHEKSKHTGCIVPDFPYKLLSNCTPRWLAITCWSYGGLHSFS